MMSRWLLTFRTVRSLVTTSSGCHLHSSLCPIHRHSQDEQGFSARGVASVISGAMPTDSPVVAASSLMQGTLSIRHFFANGTYRGSVAESDCLARRTSTIFHPCKRAFNMSRFMRSPFLSDSTFADYAISDICLAEQMNPAYRCDQKRAFASRESDEALAPKDNMNNETISVTFVDRDCDEKTIQVPIGMSMLEAAHEYNIELEGACEGSLACSTCHVIVMDEEYYGKLPEPTDEENDMLDLAFGLTETSRLGCQVIAKPELDGIRLALPAATRNFAVDGFVPKPH